MARDWPHLPKFQAEEDAAAVAPEGWSTRQIEDIFDKLEIGKRFDQKTSFASGKVPVVDQSADGFVGYHDEQPGVVASNTSPVITFANHTCEMRVMRRPFSVIQNVFPMVGRLGVCETLFFYYATKGRVHLEEYKGHYPDFRRLWINLPPLAEQKAIAAVLGALDDKIELNRRMNATLEAMARALFQSWFVDFDPVRAKLDGRQPIGMESTTAALFPEHLEDSPLGHIPKGWRACTLGDIAKNVSITFDFKRTLEVVFINTGDVLEGDFLHSNRSFHADLPGQAKKSVRPDDILFSEIRPANKRYAYVNFDSSDYVVSTKFMIIRGSKEIHPRLLYRILTAKETLDEFQVQAESRSGTFPQITFDSISHLPIVLPPIEIQEAFQRAVGKMDAQIKVNKQQSRTLATLRNTLLPKLLSGELNVNPQTD